MSQVAIGPNIFYNLTATDTARTLRIDVSYTQDQIFKVGLHAMEVVIVNKNGTFGNGLRVAFDDNTAMDGGEYLVVPGATALVIHPNVKYAIYVMRDSSTNVDFSIMVVRKNSFNSF